jgi:hypothetical protein
MPLAVDLRLAYRECVSWTGWPRFEAYPGVRGDPTELTNVPVPAPDNGVTDASVDAVRLVLLAVETGLPGGDRLDVDVLRSRVAEVLNAQQACRHNIVAAALPGLIRDVHTTLASGRDGAEVLRLVPLLHVQGNGDDVTAPLGMAAELAERTGEANAYWFGFGPTNLGSGGWPWSWKPATTLRLLPSQSSLIRNEFLLRSAALPIGLTMAGLSLE